MEKIKVNMNPNPLDVQTIHASQNDNEAREWGFELHNNGDVIDSSEITDQIVFKAYEGGTEELLPSSLMDGSVDLGSLTWVLDNGAFRSTSGIPNIVQPQASVAGNIMCPLYRTTSQSAIYATANDMCVSCLSYTNNILVRNDSFTSASDFKNAMQGVYLWYEKTDSTPTTTPINADIKYPQGLLTEQEFTYRESPTEEDGLAYVVGIKGQTLKWNQIAELENTDTTGGITVTNNRDGSLTINGTATQQVNSFPIKSSWVNGHIYMWLGIPTGVKIYNQLYKNGSWVTNLDYKNNPLIRKITSSADANRLFSSQLIASGTSFNNVTYFPMEFDLTQMFGETKAEEILAMETAQSGSGIAYFKSLFPLDYYPFNSGSLIPFNGNGIKTVGKNLLDPSSKTTYDGVNGTRWYQSQGFMLMANKTYTFSASNTNGTVVALYIIDHATRNSLASSSLVATYTPTQNVIVYLQAYRGGGIPSGTEFQLEFGSQTSYEPYISSTLSLPISTYFPTGMKSKGDVHDELTPSKAITRVGSRSYQSGDESDTSVITDGVTTYYPLTTPTETSFSTASLVTENAEIPLSNNDGVLIGKCTEELSAEPGFHDAKIKLSNSDGECYSNKIQLHVERSPQ